MTRYAAFLWIVATAALPAQSLQLAAELCADAERRGPPALVWLREAVLPRAPGWAPDLDPLGALRIEIDGTEVRCSVGSGVDGPYFGASLRLERIGELHGECDFAGLERWHGSKLRLPISRVRNLVALTGLLHHDGPITLDTAAFAGGLWAGSTGSSALELLLSLGPTECGPVTAKVTRTDGEFVFVGRSEGGALLPALIALLADLHSRPPEDGGLLTARTMDEAEAWRVLAASSRDGNREEAARQLSRHSDERSRDMLERLLQADDYTRIVAMESLIRAGAVDTLPRLLEAVDPARPDTQALAELGLWTMLPQVAPRERDRWLDHLERDPNDGLRAFAQRYRAAATAGMLPGQSPMPRPPPGITEIGWSPLRTGAFVFFLCSTLLLAYLVLSKPHQRA